MTQKGIPLEEVEKRLKGMARVSRYEIEHERLSARIGKIEGTEAIRNWMKLEEERKRQERIRIEQENEVRRVLMELEDPGSELFDPLRASKIKRGVLINE